MLLPIVGIMCGVGYFIITCRRRKEHTNGGITLLIYLSLIETDAEKHEFMALYSEYHELLLRVAKKYFPSDQMSLEDAVQNAWVQIIKNLPKILTIPCNKRGAYCVIIVKNECISLIRKRKKDISFEELSLTLADDYNNQQYIYAESITGVIRDMPETYRVILEMCFIEECSTREIAKRTSIPEATVNTRIFRGRKLLIERLQKEGLI